MIDNTNKHRSCFLSLTKQQGRAGRAPNPSSSSSAPGRRAWRPQSSRSASPHSPSAKAQYAHEHTVARFLHKLTLFDDFFFVICSCFDVQFALPSPPIAASALARKSAASWPQYCSSGVMCRDSVAMRRTRNLVSNVDAIAICSSIGVVSKKKLKEHILSNLIVESRADASTIFDRIGAMR